MFFLKIFLCQIEKYFVYLHPQTENPRCKGGEGCIYMIWRLQTLVEQAFKLQS